ncbi:toll/interleukin-1 receptor domain-containing protein [Sphingomonas arenae]|uniref:toll/interleukin-1 receptor domain-containing protein n=1 Tax=Sphingomonas arenae TaxID=2812555 RepID=UPI001968200B|nr:toll/interleukin-1 receptor domain-containing protein [Sphingomonas arenae]
MEGSVVLQQRPNAARNRRAGSRLSSSQRYWAFISYAHEDAETAEWLQEALEQYRVPDGLVGKLTDVGPVPRRLSPIFRDRSELPAAGSLSDEIEEAVQGSRFLIVLCSPAAAQSRWTNEEITCFKKHHSEDQVLAAILSGEPFASEVPGREHEECFPPALRTHFNRRGLPTSRRAEPVAADLREGGDGRRAGFLKIVAGMLGVGLDDVVQREIVRRQRRTNLIVGGSVLGMLVTSSLAVAAIQARDAARDQRREAEGLIGFMLGDLREKLEPIGRLDALDAVGARALSYYAKQDAGGLGDESLAQRARALTLMGDIAQRRGDLDGALSRYRQAAASTSELLRRHSDEPQRMYDHAQNLFYFGYVAWQRGRTAESLASFRQYKQLAERMIALDPREQKWRLEGIYADTVLGTVLLEQQKYDEALPLFSSTLGNTDRLLAGDANNAEYQYQLLETQAYLADAYRGAGRLAEALMTRQSQLALLDRLQRERPDDMALQRKAARAHESLATLLLMRGATEAANDEASKSLALGERLLRTEPDNTEWVDRISQAYLTAASARLAADQLDDARRFADAGCALVNRLIARDDSVVFWSETLRRRCLLQKAAIDLRAGQPMQAFAWTEQAAGNVLSARARTPGGSSDLARARLLGGDALKAMGRPADAQRQWTLALREWPAGATRSPENLATWALLLRRTGSDDQAAALAGKLREMGYREPDYTRGMRQGG